MSTDGSVPTVSLISLADGRHRLRMSILAVWIGYFSVGGNGSLSDVDNWMTGVNAPSLQDHDLLAQALNHRFTEAGLAHPVAYSRA